MKLLYRRGFSLVQVIGTTNNLLVGLPGPCIIHHALIRYTQSIVGGTVKTALGTTSGGAEWLTLPVSGRGSGDPVGYTQGALLADRGTDLSAAPYWKAYPDVFPDVYLQIVVASANVTQGKVVVELHGVPIYAP